MSFLKIIKKIILPSKSKVLKFPFGLSSGIVMRVDFNYQTRLYLGLYELEIASHCKRLLQRCGNAFDIGGNNGYYTFILGKHTGGKVISVEPVDEHIRELRENISQNSYPVTAIQAFVGAKQNDGIVTIDQLSDEYFKPDFIKMDIEGGEVDALKGGLKLIKTHRPHMVIEVHSEALELDCRQILEEYGYKITRINPRAWLPEGRVDDYNGWIICEGSPRHN